MVLAISAHWGDTILESESFGEESLSATIFARDFDLDELRAELEPARTVRIEEGPLVYLARDIPRAILRQPQLLDRLEYRWINALLIVLFFHSAAIMFFAGAPLGRAALPHGLFPNRTKFVQVALTAAVARPALHSGPTTPGPIAKKPEPRGGNKRDLVGSLFGGGRAQRSIFGEGGLGGELVRALGNVQGAPIGDGGGGIGIGSRGGSGPGPIATVGIGDLARRPAGYGEGIGRTTIKKSEAAIVPTLGPPMIKGSLDKEVIRSVIRRHINQIRYCYELELVRDPGAFGKVATRFVIGPTGSVTEVEVKESLANDRSLSDCIAARIKTWKFPAPKGGGIVVVNYPFIVHTAG